MSTKVTFEDTDIPSERVIKLLLAGHKDGIWLRIDPLFGRTVQRGSINLAMDKIRQVAKPGSNPTDRLEYCTSLLNDVLEVYSSVEVFAEKPGLLFGCEVICV